MPRYLVAQQFGRKMRLSLWAWLLWGLPIYFVLEFGAFLIIGLGLKKPVGDLVGPYLAFAMPAVILMPLVWSLRMWEEEGASPKRLARGWGLGMALFGVAVQVATFYSGIKFHLIDPDDAIGGFITAFLIGVPAVYFVMYHMALTRISSRLATKLDGPPRQPRSPFP